MKFEDMINTIQLGDCYELIKLLPNESVDVSFTSPPYNSIRWQKYEQNENSKNYYEEQKEIIEQMLRVSKKYVIYNIQANHYNKHDVYKLIGHFADNIKRTIIWVKKNCIPNRPNSMINSYEFIFIMTNSKDKEVYTNTPVYRDTIIQKGNSGNEYSSIHKAIMPLDLANEIIKEFTNENDIVLDTFSGLGTTAIACIQQHRNYIGFELNETYYKESLNRINLEKNQTTIFDFIESEEQNGI